MVTEMLVVKEEDGNKEMGNHMLLVIVHIEAEKGFFGILKELWKVQIFF